MRRSAGFLLGTVYVQLVSAEPGKAITYYSQNGVALCAPTLTAPLTLEFYIPAGQWGRLKALAEKRGDKCQRLAYQGIGNFLHRLKKRWFFCTIFAAMLLFALYAPSRIWFIQVEGNNSLSDREILAAAETCGLTFWQKVDNVRSERLKNQILNMLPELQWAGVNFSGGIATISVRERLTGDSIRDTSQITDVVASRDGIIVSMSVLGGQTLCKIGQAVTAGEVLVTGCIEHEYQTQYTCADAEVYALTQRELTAVHPLAKHKKVYTGEKRYGIWLVFGKSKIKIFGNSGISDTSCDKMTDTKPLTLPGGFTLPIALEIVTCSPYEIESENESGKVQERMEQCLRERALSDMIAGEIIGTSLQYFEDDRVCSLNVIYSCREMIARQKKVLLFEGEATNDGTNRKRGASGRTD